MNTSKRMTGTMITATFSVGDRVEAGEGEDHDTGKIMSIDGDVAMVAWDSLVTTPCNTSALSHA